MISVLLVDDEPPALDSGKRYLETKGHYKVSTALSPLTALEMLKTGHYDIIISDYNMPDMDGIGFLKEVRAAYPTLPFILYTSKSRTDIGGEAFDNEADFYLQRTGNPILVMEELTQKILIIVERRSMQEALRASEEKFRQLFSRMPSGVAIYEAVDNGEDFVFRDFNTAGEAIEHVRKAEVIGKRVTEVFPGVKEFGIFSVFQRVWRTGKPEFFPMAVYQDARNPGTWREIWTYKLPTGEIVSIYNDITERKRAEEALRQANKQLNLLSSITRHDILNQLMALKGYLYLSRDYLGDNKTLSDFLAKEEKAANTIEHQIKFTKDYQELGVAAPKWQNVNASIHKVIAGLPMRDVHVEPDPADPEVYADPLFEKVFYNLIDNALRYGGDQMKMIRISSEESDTSLTIVCEDGGVGITAEDKKRLFTKGFGKNTGLGLFLSREILAITGITITENGMPGKGARFEILVPKGGYRMREDTGV